MKKSRHGKNRSDHQGQDHCHSAPESRWSFPGARIVFDADGPAHLDRVCQGPYLPV